MRSLFWAKVLVYILQETNGSPYMLVDVGLLVEESPVWINIYWHWTSAVTHPDSSSISLSLLCLHHYINVFKQTHNLHRETPAWVSNPILFKGFTPAGATVTESVFLAAIHKRLRFSRLSLGDSEWASSPPLQSSYSCLAAWTQATPTCYISRGKRYNLCKLCLEPSHCSAVSVAGVEERQLCKYFYAPCSLIATGSCAVCPWLDIACKGIPPGSNIFININAAK